jgi:hypothetical protein
MMWKEAAFVYFALLSLHFPAGSNRTHEEPQSEQLVSGPRYEHRISQTKWTTVIYLKVFSMVLNEFHLSLGILLYMFPYMHIYVKYILLVLPSSNDGRTWNMSRNDSNGRSGHPISKMNQVNLWAWNELHCVHRKGVKVKHFPKRENCIYTYILYMITDNIWTAAYLYLKYKQIA